MQLGAKHEKSFKHSSIDLLDKFSSYKSRSSTLAFEEHKMIRKVNKVWMILEEMYFLANE